MPNIGIINYGVGNLRSVKNSLDYLGIQNSIITKPQDMKSFKRIILPGVGAFEPAMKKLNDLGFTKEINKFAKTKPVLGICLGMQLLFDESYEHGKHKGLGLIEGKVLPFSEKVKKLPVPLMGWNNVTKENDSPVMGSLGNDPSFYFVHSFYCEPRDKKIVTASANYGIDFAAIVHKNNILGCQFHPEKSQSNGLQILQNFSEL